MVLAALLALSLAASGGSTGSPPSLPSVHGGETLGPGAAELAFVAGFSTLSASYLQGVGEATDYGAQLEADWLTGELFAGGLYRSLQWRSGGLAFAARARAGLYADLGATWALSANRSAAGAQLAPGLVLSARVSRGLFSLGADAPVTFTFSNGGGTSLGARGTLAFETQLWGDLLAGARAGIGGLWSSASAPFASDSPRALVDLSALITYRIF